jgi:hypothetical protein
VKFRSLGKQGKRSKSSSVWDPTSVNIEDKLPSISRAASCDGNKSFTASWFSKIRPNKGIKNFWANLHLCGQGEVMGK